MPLQKKGGGKTVLAACRTTEREDHLEEDATEVTHHDDPLPQDGTFNAIVKMKLTSFCDSAIIRNELQSVVMNANIVLGEAYTFANFHILRILHHNLEHPEDVLEMPKMDRNFYYRCLLAVTEFKFRASTMSAALQESATLFDALRATEAPRVSMVGEVQLLADLSISMATMASNHLWMNLEKRLSRHIKCKYPVLARTKGLLKKVMDAVLGRMKPAAVQALLVVPADAMGTPREHPLTLAAQAIAELSELAPPGGIVQRKPASQSHLTLPLYHRMLQEAVAGKESAMASRLVSPAIPSAPRRRSCRWKTFSLLPTKGGFTLSYVPISNMTMMRILKVLKLEAIKGDGRDAEHLTIWRKHFNTRLVETRTRHFDCRIATDGCGVSIQLKKITCACCQPPPLTEVQKAELLARETLRVVGVDPGVTDIVTTAVMNVAPSALTSASTPAMTASLHAAVVNGNVPAEHGSYSSSRYYERAKIKLSNRRTSKWNQDDESAPLMENLPSCQVASFTAFEDHTRKYLAVLRPLLEHRAKKGYRNMRFLRYVYKKKAIADICKLIAPRNQFTLVGFENWQGVGPQCPISRRTCGPLQEIRQTLFNMPNVAFLAVDPYRTSVTCCYCHRELKNMVAISTRYDRRTKQRVAKMSRVHKVLHCKRSVGSPSTGCPGATCNRDINASRNILLLTLCMLCNVDKPAAFCPRGNSPGPPASG
jgi:hypothetical protein